MSYLPYQVRVSYDETDQMGFAHHSNYPKYCEKARWDVFWQLGIPYSEIERIGIIIPVVEMEFKFHKSTGFDEILTINTEFESIYSASFLLNYTIKNQNDEIICRAKTKLAFVDKVSKKPIRPPENIRNIIENEFRKTNAKT